LAVSHVARFGFAAAGVGAGASGVVATGAGASGVAAAGAGAGRF